jgi:hypothetical protein
VHPRIYNHLLAKLAGTSDAQDTLLTVREASDGSVYARTRESTATGETTSMKPSAEIRAYAARIASTHPEIAFDLTNLSTKVAEEEKKKEEDKPKDKEEDKGKPFPGAAAPFGKKEAAECDKEKEAEGQDEPKEQQTKQAYAALRASVIHTAALNPQLRAALTPALRLIKQNG